MQNHQLTQIGSMAQLKYLSTDDLTPVFDQLGSTIKQVLGELALIESDTKERVLRLHVINPPF